MTTSFSYAYQPEEQINFELAKEAGFTVTIEIRINKEMRSKHRIPWTRQRLPPKSTHTCMHPYVHPHTQTSYRQNRSTPFGIPSGD
eukprot:458237-Pelagomonas_calceolata.AAC.5